MLEFLDTSTSEITFEIIVWGLFIGIIIAGAMSVYYKRYLGALVRAIKKQEAFSPETAATLEELGLEKKRLIKRAILRSTAFKSIVYEKNDEVTIEGESAVPVYHDQLDFSSARFYIPYELRYRADIKFEKKGTNIALVIIGGIIFLAIAILLTTFKSQAVEFIERIFKGITS